MLVSRHQPELEANDTLVRCNTSEQLEPRGQGMHVLFHNTWFGLHQQSVRLKEDAVSGGHDRHAVVPASRAYCPSEHCSHVTEPSASANVPGEQIEQIPDALPAVPRGHTTQEDTPVALLNVPARHTVHEVAPITSLNVPAQ